MERRRARGAVARRLEPRAAAAAAAAAVGVAAVTTACAFTASSSGAAARVEALHERLEHLSVALARALRDEKGVAAVVERQQRRGGSSSGAAVVVGHFCCWLLLSAWLHVTDVIGESCWIASECDIGVPSCSSKECAKHLENEVVADLMAFCLQFSPS